MHLQQCVVILRRHFINLHGMFHQWLKVTQFGYYLFCKMLKNSTWLPKLNSNVSSNTRNVFDLWMTLRCNFKTSRSKQKHYKSFMLWKIIYLVPTYLRICNHILCLHTVATVRSRKYFITRGKMQKTYTSMCFLHFSSSCFRDFTVDR